MNVILKNGLPDVHYTVVGLGKTGLSCTRFLAKRGLQVSVVDSRNTPPGLAELQAEYPEMVIHTGGFDAATMSDSDILVVSPGISIKEPAIQAAHDAGAELVGDVELFARLAKAPVIAITGSNGKSTVTDLLGEMAKASNKRVGVGGNIGTPVLELLDDKYELYVLELSSFQLETTHSLNAVAGTVLNISADHMDRYDSLDEYAAAKQSIFRGDGVMVINADDTVVADMAEPGRKIIRFSLHHPVEGDYGLLTQSGENWLAKGAEPLMSVDELKLPGRHNQANALAALALGDAVGLERAAMLKALQNYAGLSHRTQWVAKINGVDWYNDSKGTNVGATVAAIAGLDEKLILIAGGEGKGADFSPLKDAVRDKVEAVILIGRDARKIADVLAECVAVSFADTMEEAVELAAQKATAGMSILLSPACASFDMFDSYGHRGEVFMQAVKRLSNDN
ncbi:MAG: UDP-N-acetylmuramoyl-L-alanine--D-glutamate ligase [Gammaproteobacteria bacterium]|nr:UDP-N-acetylmuramoyl-L-alanine--D-glutamate ligase [Gammaproteobacteria bacterium]